MPSEKIAIITDSTSDIPSDLVKEYDIAVVPHTIIWGEKQFLDRVDLQPEEFYQRVQNGESIPTSAQATEKQFLQTYMDVIRKGYRQILVITLSNKLSGAIQSATNAAKDFDFPVQIIDSLSVTMGYGWQVLAAARFRDMGMNMQQIVDKINEIRKSISLFVCMDTMAFLRHGGRIGDAARLLGMVLNIKPVVQVSNITGVVEEVGISRTYKKAVDMMYGKFFETMDKTKKMHIAVLHGNAFEEAEKLVERIYKEYNPVEIITSITGPVLGINTGPGALALAGYTEE